MKQVEAIKAHLAVYWALALLLSGCTPSPDPSFPGNPTPLARHSCIGMEEGPSLAGSEWPQPLPMLVGGSVRTGQFVIGIWLYCDPQLSSADYFSPDYSEISGLGFRYEWYYLGLPVQGDTQTVISINGVEVSRDGVGPDLNTGSAGALTGPIKTEDRIIAEAAASGTSVNYTVTVRAPHVTEAVILQVEFSLADEGYYVSQLSLRPVGE